jgi:hypothetical protein
MRCVGSALILATLVPAHAFATSHALRASQAPLIRTKSPVTMAQNDQADLVDRAFAAAVYLFPITDGFQFGKFIYQQVPPVGALAQVIYPSIQAFDAIPFSGLIFFFGLSALSRNPGLSRFLRFNLQQAILLDIAFIIPGFVGSVGQSFPLVLQQTGCNTIFYFMVLAIGYAWYEIAQGKAPDQIPIISDAAAQSIGPM